MIHPPRPAMSGADAERLKQLLEAHIASNCGIILAACGDNSGGLELALKQVNMSTVEALQIVNSINASILRDLQQQAPSVAMAFESIILEFQHSVEQLLGYETQVGESTYKSGKDALQ